MADHYAGVELGSVGISSGSKGGKFSNGTLCVS